MISIRSSYHPIDAAILWCGLSEYEEEILQVEFSHPGSLRKQFSQWPGLHDHLECIYDAILSGELPATYLGSRSLRIALSTECTTPFGAPIYCSGSYAASPIRSPPSCLPKTLTTQDASA